MNFNLFVVCDGSTNMTFHKILSSLWIKQKSGVKVTLSPLLSVSSESLSDNFLGFWQTSFKGTAIPFSEVSGMMN